MRPVAKRAVLTTQALDFALELIRHASRTRRRHQTALPDERVNEQHSYRKSEKIIQRPTPQRTA